MTDYTQLGIAGATLGILLLVVRFFINFINRKDDQIQKITEKFADTVNTHLANEKISREQEMAALLRITEVLDQHTQVLSTHTKAFTELTSGVNQISMKYGRRKTDRPFNQRG